LFVTNFQKTESKDPALNNFLYISIHEIIEMSICKHP
jgi:hypothetical protein